MDGSTSINNESSVKKWKRKGSNKSETSSSSQVVNTNGSETKHDIATASTTARDNSLKTSGQQQELAKPSSLPSKLSSSTTGAVNGVLLEPPSPKRILQLKKQLEKEEQNHQKTKLGGCNGKLVGANGNGFPSATQVINRLASLDEEEEEILTSLDLQHHYQQQQIDQFPCTLLKDTKFSPYSSVNNRNHKMKSSGHGSSESAAATDRRSDVGHLQQRITWLKQLKLYLNSLRPRTFTPSLASVTLGAVLAWKATGHFDLLIFIVSCLTVLAVHGAGNLVNTYYDFVKGIDRSTQSVNQCPYRTLVDHQLSIDQVVHLGVIAYMFGCFGFVCLVFLSPARMEHLALVYFCGISCSFLYTGGLGLKYIGLGDILVMVIFGPISILFSFMSQSGYIDPATIAFALPLAFHTEAILHSNNTRDIESDQRAGAVTLAILIGPTFCHIVYALLLFIPYIMLIVSIIHYSIVFVIPLITITKAFQLEKNFRSGHLNDIPSATASLHLIFSISYIISCCLIHPDNLPLLHVEPSVMS